MNAACEKILFVILERKNRQRSICSVLSVHELRKFLVVLLYRPFHIEKYLFIRLNRMDKAFSSTEGNPPKKKVKYSTEMDSKKWDLASLPVSLECFML